MKRFLVPLLLFSTTAAYGEVYTWKDARGTDFYTNNYDEIPARYLKRARVLDVATGKKGKLATEQPPVQAPGQPVPGSTPVVPPPPAVNPAPVATPVAPVYQPSAIGQPQPQVSPNRPLRRMRHGRERVREEE